MLKGIFHPTDFSPASDVAFAHALKLALATRSELTVLHFAQASDIDNADGDLHEFPPVRETLTRWGLLPGNSPREAVAALGLHVRKLGLVGDDPTEAIVGYLGDHPAHLMVLATHQRSGAARWLNRAVAQPIASRSVMTVMTALFVPPGVPGFIDFDTGKVRLERILFPIDQHPHPRGAIEMLSALVRAFHHGPVAVQLLHVGDETTLPHVHVPQGDGWTWTTTVAKGDVVEEITRAAAEGPADLMVMTTQGRRGFLDALRGSATERIIRATRCPVLAVPTIVPADARSWVTLQPTPSPGVS